MHDIQHILPVTKVKRAFLDILRTMQEEDATITLTKNGEPVGVMMTPDRYESLIETIEILADKKVIASLMASKKILKLAKCTPTKKSGESDGWISPVFFRNLSQPDDEITPRNNSYYLI